MGRKKIDEHEIPEEGMVQEEKNDVKSDELENDISVQGEASSAVMDKIFEEKITRIIEIKKCLILGGLFAIIGFAVALIAVKCEVAA